MPKTGTPASNSPAGAAGGPSAYTDAGPPDRMIAFGFLASISGTGIVDGTISEYTWHSRTRRAMSWAYCAPKSTTRTVSNPPGPDTPTPSRFTGAIAKSAILSRPQTAPISRGTPPGTPRVAGAIAKTAILSRPQPAF